MKRVLTLLAPLMLAASAYGADVERTFAIEFGGPAPVRDVVRRGASQWAADAVKAGLPDGEATTPWDPATLGPLDIVSRRAVVEVSVSDTDSATGVATVSIRMDDSNLPSGAATVNAFAERLSKSLVARMSAAAEDEARLDRNRRAHFVNEASARRELAETKLAAMEVAESGAVSDRLASATDRLLTAERDAASVRIDRTVTAKQLDVARAAAQRAVQVARLRDDADHLAARAAEGQTADAKRTLLEQLAELRRRIDDATAKSPSLDTARERVFDLEVALVGFETREAALAEEVKALREAVARLATIARQYNRLVEDASYWAGRAREHADAFAASEQALPPVFVRLRAQTITPK